MTLSKITQLPSTSTACTFANYLPDYEVLCLVARASPINMGENESLYTEITSAYVRLRRLCFESEGSGQGLGEGQVF